MELTKSLLAGAGGSVALSVLHESLRKVDNNAPRMDKLGKQALKRYFKVATKDKQKLYLMSLGAELLSNSLYYSISGTGKRAWQRGLGLGVAAGLGAVILPPFIGLSKKASTKSVKTVLYTIGLYTIGGLVAGFAGSWLHNNQKTATL